MIEVLEETLRALRRGFTNERRRRRPIELTIEAMDELKEVIGTKGARRTP